MWQNPVEELLKVLSHLEQIDDALESGEADLQHLENSLIEAQDKFLKGEQFMRVATRLFTIEQAENFIRQRRTQVRDRLGFLERRKQFLLEKRQKITDSM